ncbi:MAG: sensor histidine kinase [Phycisphaerales bacterium]
MSGDFRRTLWLSGAAVAVVIGALAFVTMQTLTLETREHRSREEARWQEQLRTALWRMEHAMSPLLSREAARPYFQYRAFYPPGRAYTQMFEQVSNEDVLVPSPLLCAGEPFIKLHFQRESDGTLGSPTVPQADVARQTQEEVYCSPQRVADADFMLRALAGLLARTDLSKHIEEATATRVSLVLAPGAFAAPGPAPGPAAWRDSQRVQSRAGADLSARNTAVLRAQSNRAPEVALRQNETAQQEAQIVLAEQQRGLESGAALDPALAQTIEACATPIDQSDFISVWIDGFAGPELLMTRSVTVGGESFVQGVWFDWPQLREFLLGQIADLLPMARIEPIREPSGARRAALTGNPLASIAAELVTGPAPHTALAAFTPTRLTLLLAWLVTAVAAVSVTRMLFASIELAERRGRFVSAVTHELRTPLTTFCMYSQMLADGVVTDEPSRREYYTTLREQSLKLARIVEDVLAFARLSRRARPAPISAESAADLGSTLNGLLPALSRRAESTGMRIEATGVDACSGIKARASAETIERIVCNLVDNAAKYACGAADSRIVLVARYEGSARGGGRVVVDVQDFGPGVCSADRARLFEPFERGEEHDRSAIAGLGLGLALSRALARECGGDLVLAQGGPGAKFILTLPTAA